MGNSASIEKQDLPSNESNSAPNLKIAAETTLETTTATESQPESTTQTETKPKLSGYPLVQRRCRKKKAAYDQCFSTWYKSRFIAGRDLSRNEDCDELFDIYRSCIMRGMRKEWDRQGLDPPKKGSLLAEFDEDNEETS